VNASRSYRTPASAVRPSAALAILALAAGLALGACTLPPPATIAQQPITVRPPHPPEVATGNGSIYQARGSYRPLFEDRRARHVGDTLTIEIAEKTAANNKGASEASRVANTSASVSSLVHVPAKDLVGLSVAGDSSNKFAGGGQSSSSNDFTGFITVTVIDVLANGNLVVSGEKQIAMTDGTQFIRFSGVVNPRTINAANAVVSAQVADARIEYKANGYIDSARVMGWLARFFLTFLPF